MKFKLPSPIGLARLSLLGVLTGVTAGAGAVFFRDLIGLIHNLAFLGRFAIEYDASQFTLPGPFGAFVIVMPVLGSLAVTFLVEKFAPEARGHGVPEIIDAIYYNKGVIRPVVGAVKSFASAISIGTGAAVGREGPIAQIGASFGSFAGQIITMAPWERTTLVAAGAGAGIAATFNTPIGGVMFAVELLMPEFSARTFLPVALAAGTSTFIGRIFFGIHPAFAVPGSIMPQGPAALPALLIYAFLGVVGGLAAALFIRGLSLSEQLYQRIGNPYIRHAAGMLIFGLLVYVMLVRHGHYYIEGVGYATIQSILGGDLNAPVLLPLLFFAKLYGTWTTLGSGGSGGIFSPSLYLGASMGAAFGMLTKAIFPAAGIAAAPCAIIGMAAMAGGSTGAAMTAVTMIFEMTRDYDVVMPSIVAVALAIGIRRLLSRESIYTIKLVGRRHFVPDALQANVLVVMRASDIMERDIKLLSVDANFDSVLVPHHGAKGLPAVVVRGDHITGVANLRSCPLQGSQESFGKRTVGDITQRNFIIAREDDPVFKIMTRMARRRASVAVVTKGRGRPFAMQVTGIITKEGIADTFAKSLTLSAQ